MSLELESIPIDGFSSVAGCFPLRRRRIVRLFLTTAPEGSVDDDGLVDALAGTKAHSAAEVVETVETSLVLGPRKWVI